MNRITKIIIGTGVLGIATIVIGETLLKKETSTTKAYDTTKSSLQRLESIILNISKEPTLQPQPYQETMLHIIDQTLETTRDNLETLTQTSDVQARKTVEKAQIAGYITFILSLTSLVGYLEFKKDSS